MDSERSIIEGGASAATCTCGDDLARNGGWTHNYACPMTPKCQNPIPSGGICGCRLEPEYACHKVGCPCLPLCSHCGIPMNQGSIHSMGCPNRSNYSHHGIHLPDRIPTHQDFQNFFEIFMDAMRSIAAISPRNPVSPPQIIGEDFEIRGDCSICHDLCVSSQSVMKPAECNHCFHVRCLTPWIQEHSTCPNCRREIQTILQKN